MMFVRTVKYFSFKNSIIKYLITNSILNVSPQISRSFSITKQCYRIKFPAKEIDPKIKVPDDPYLLIKLISKQDNLEDAISIVLNTKKSAQSVVVWNHLIDECIKKGRVKFGFRLLNEMKKRAFVPNQQTYTILLNGIAENQPFEDNIEQAKNLLENMQQVSARYDQVKVNVIHINCFLKVCAWSNNFNALMENFNELINKGNWEPNKETYTIIFNACARQGSDGYETALKLWDQLDINPNGNIIDDDLIRSMLLVCKFCGDHQKGFEIIRNIYGLETDYEFKSTLKSPSFICNLSTQTFDTILGICIVSKQYKRGIKLFDDALRKFPDISLDICNFNKLIVMCNKAEEYDKAISIIKTIRARGLHLSLETYDLLITSCKNNEDWTTAEHLYKELLYNNKFNSRVLNRMFELAEIKRVKNNSLAEVKWLLDSSHKFVLDNFITSIENENRKDAYHYKRLLRQMKNAYKSLALDRKLDLTDEQMIYNNNVKKLKMKLSEAKEWDKKSSSVHLKEKTNV